MNGNYDVLVRLGEAKMYAQTMDARKMYKQRR